MKKLIVILSILSASFVFSQTATNKIQSTATIFSTNSPVTINTLLTSSNIFITDSVNSTNYQVGSVQGLSISITNLGIAETNVHVYGSGILTNKFTIP